MIKLGSFGKPVLISVQRVKRGGASELSSGAVTVCWESRPRCTAQFLDCFDGAQIAMPYRCTPLLEFLQGPVGQASNSPYIGE